MAVMVTVNVETELDVANGVRGVVVDVILDRREERDHLNLGAEVKLKYPPECVFVKLNCTKALQLPGLDQGAIPIFPMERSFDVLQKKGKSLRAKHRQLPLTSAYAFTDYHLQGQTISCVIVDIGRPPLPGKLTVFNIYVALSRSMGQDTICLLRDFDTEILTQPPCRALQLEDIRLEDLNLQTLCEREKRTTRYVISVSRSDVPC
jgi:ATP-dependent exoDNAse (exonuclease V) alpha subunit